MAEQDWMGTPLAPWIVSAAHDIEQEGGTEEAARLDPQYKDASKLAMALVDESDPKGGLVRRLPSVQKYLQLASVARLKDAHGSAATPAYTPLTTPRPFLGLTPAPKQVPPEPPVETPVAPAPTGKDIELPKEGKDIELPKETPPPEPPIAHPSELVVPGDSTPGPAPQVSVPAPAWLDSRQWGQAAKDVLHRGGQAVTSYVKGLFTPPEDIRQIADLVKAQIDQKMPETNIGGTGHPLIDTALSAPFNLQQIALKTAVDQVVDATTPGGAAGNVAEPLKALEAAGIAIPALRMLRLPKGGLEESLHIGKSRAMGGGIHGYSLTDEVKENLQKLYELGEHMRNFRWQSVHDPGFIDLFGGHHELASLFAGFWGATSPQNNVATNTSDAVKVMLHYLQNTKDPYLVKEAGNVLNMGMWQTKINNINRVLHGERMMSGDFEGKVQAMRDFMEGLRRLPIDMHALYALGDASKDWDPHITGLKRLFGLVEDLPKAKAGQPGLTAFDVYQRYEQAMVKALEEIAPHQRLNDVFASVWEGSRIVQEHLGFKGVSYQGVPQTILEKKIRDTGLPAAGALINPQNLIRMLAHKGTWSAPALAGLAYLIENSGAYTPPGQEPAPVAPGFSKPGGFQ